MLNYPNPVYHEVVATLDRDRSMRAAERFELQQALRELDQRRRDQRRTKSRHRLGSVRRLVLDRLA